MAKRKWYVVIVGKDIGVFSNWVEAGPLVKGVPDAVYQSFPSEEEARRVYALSFSKGHTRIVGPNPNHQHRSPQPGDPTFSSGISNDPYSNGSSSAMSSIPLTKTICTCLSPRQHRPRAISAHEAPKSLNHESNSHLRPVSYVVSKPANNSSQPTTSDRPYNNNKKPTAENVPVEARIFKEDTQLSTPQSDPTGLSPSLKRLSHRPRAIVKTPSWLVSYPKSPQPLSPLDNEYVSFNNFRTGDSDQGINFKPSPSGSSMYCTHTPRMSPQNNGSVNNSNISFSPPVRHVHIQQDKDPRSPMLSQAKIPASALNCNISFGRPSPSLRRDPLPAGLHEFEAPRSSLLFHSTTQKEDH